MATEILATRTWVNHRIDGVANPDAYTCTITDDNKAVIVGYDHDILNGPHVIMPHKLQGGRDCTEISAAVFTNNTDIETIVCPKPLTKIHAGAFSGCTNLTAIMIYGDRTTIDETEATVFGNLPTNQVTVYRLSTATGWSANTTFYGMRVVEVDSFESVLRTNRPIYLRDTATNELHEIRITNSSLNSGLIQ